MVSELTTVTLIANGGILLTTGALHFLIDGLHHDPFNYPDFSPVSQENLKKIINQQSPFKKIDYLLFTHEHGDHFSPYYTAEYLRYNTPKGIFIPQMKTKEYQKLLMVIKKRQQIHHELACPLGEKRYFQIEKNVMLTLFQTKHAAKRYSSIENYCFILTIGKKNDLFIADADYNQAYFSEMLKGFKIDTVFVNPLYINKKIGREIIKNTIAPRQVVVYHLPFEADDKQGYRKAVQRDIKRYTNLLPKVIVLEDDNQTINL